MTGTGDYVRNQAVAAGLVNAVLNPFIEWVLNRSKGFQPFWGAGSVAVNLAVTSVILSCLVALFSARGVRHELALGRVAALPGSALLGRLPGRAGWLGLAAGIGAGAAGLAVFWMLAVTGVSGMPFWGLLVLKAGYCGVLGYLVARWTILRILMP